MTLFIDCFYIEQRQEGAPLLQSTQGWIEAFSKQVFKHMEKQTRISATNQVVNTIRLALQNGQLKIGDKLPREADMAEKLGVGRSTLREGIKILTAYGVVEPRQGEGTFIVDNSARNLFEFMGFFPSKENTAFYLELRRALEVGNIACIYDKIPDNELDELQKLVEILGKKASIDTYVEADQDFHHWLISYTQNPMLIQINKMLSVMRTDLLYRMFCYPELVKDAYIVHGKIVRALRNRDRFACIQIVDEHLSTTIAQSVQFDF